MNETYAVPATRLAPASQGIQRPPKDFKLRPIEILILEGQAAGLTYIAIGQKVKRSVKTIHAHASTLLQKMGCESITQAVAEAIRNKIIE